MSADTTPPARKPLTEREQQILPLVAEGLTNPQIGVRLHLAENTVKHYVNGMLRDWGVETRQALAWTALQEGVLPCPCKGVRRG